MAPREEHAATMPVDLAELPTKFFTEAKLGQATRHLVMVPSDSILRGY
jgi:hypothetical protein